MKKIIITFVLSVLLTFSALTSFTPNTEAATTK